MTLDDYFIYPNQGIKYIINYNNIKCTVVQDDIIYIGEKGQKSRCVTLCNNGETLLKKILYIFK